jgi:hypothetical protein
LQVQTGSEGNVSHLSPITAPSSSTSVSLHRDLISELKPLSSSPYNAELKGGEVINPSSPGGGLGRPESFGLGRPESFVQGDGGKKHAAPAAKRASVAGADKSRVGTFRLLNNGHWVILFGHVQSRMHTLSCWSRGDGLGLSNMIYYAAFYYVSHCAVRMTQYNAIRKFPINITRTPRATQRHRIHGDRLRPNKHVINKEL